MRTCIEYVWVDKNLNYRSKCKVMNNEINELNASINEIYLFSLINKNIDISSIFHNFNEETPREQILINKLKLYLRNFSTSSLNLDLIDKDISIQEDNILSNLLYCLLI